LTEVFVRVRSGERELAEHPAPVLGDDDLIAQFHAMLRADLTRVQLDERHVLLDHGIGVGLRVLRMTHARVLLLQPDAVDHASVPLLEEALEDRGSGRGQLGAADARPHERLHRLQPVV